MTVCPGPVQGFKVTPEEVPGSGQGPRAGQPAFGVLGWHLTRLLCPSVPASGGWAPLGVNKGGGSSERPGWLAGQMDLVQPLHLHPS